jgi:pSer/pThr/pTyr-binding forkhead associated (FHA) protein
MLDTEVTVKTVSRIRRMERQDGPASLEQVEGPGAGQIFLIEKDQMTLGRAKGSDFHVRSERLSRHHAIFERKGADCVIRDNESVNGVLLNGLRIHSAVLRDGDVIQTGDTIFVFRGS